jgi:diacylglycerol kinase family enzyme
VARARSCLIVNPVASGVGARTIEEARDALEEFSDVEIVRTERRGHAEELARAAASDGVAAVVVLAGDGTANEVVNGAAGKVPIGVLPAGGTSVLSRALGLPRSVDASARRIGAAIADGRTRTISLGTIDGRRFAFAAGIGFDADAVRRVDARGRDSGRRPGDGYFLLQVARTLTQGRYRRPLLTVEAPGHEPVRGASLFVANGNPWTYLGPVPLRMAPRATFEGGLDLVVASSMAIRNVPAYARYLFVTGGHDRDADQRLRYLHDVESVIVRCDEPLPAQADGDDLGDVTELHLGVIRDGAELLV